MENAPNNSAFMDIESVTNKEAPNREDSPLFQPKEAFVYREDVVRCKNKGEMLGIVIEVAGDDDSDGSITDESDSEDGEDKSDKAAGPAAASSRDSADSGTNMNQTDEDVPESLPDDQVRVSWMDGSTTNEHITDVMVVDRGFLHGDMVASLTDPTGQLGLVLDLNITVDLVTASGEVIKSVLSGDLKRIREIGVGDFVVSGPWLGRVDDVLDNVTVLFDDGSVCKVVRADPMKLKSISKPPIDETSCPYYPGQRVRAVSSSVFKTSRWLTGLWKASRLEGTVTKVETVGVVVYWIASAYFAENQSSVPSEEQNPKNLTLLSCFTYANWQLADRCFLHSPPNKSADDGYGSGDGQENEEQMENNSDLLSAADNYSESNAVVNGGLNSEHQSFVKQQQTAQESLPTYRKKLKKVFFKRDKRVRRRDETFEKALLVTNIVTKIDVAWQDGTRQYGLDSRDLIPIHNPNDHDFFPEQFVVEKSSSETDDSLVQNRRMGIVRSVNAKDRTVMVGWVKPEFRPEAKREFENEIVSAYELDMHPDYDYCYGDVVVRLPSVSQPSETGNSSVANSAEMKEEYADAMDLSSCEMDGGGEKPVSEHESFGNMVRLSWVGNITGFQDGDIEVMWGDGTMSKVGPHEVYVVGRDDDGDSFEGGSEGSEGGASWETVDDEMDTDTLESSTKETDAPNPSDNITEKEKNGSSSEEDGGAGIGRGGPLSVPLAAIGYVTRLASELFLRGKKQAGSEHGEGLQKIESEESDNDLVPHGSGGETVKGHNGDMATNDMEISCSSNGSTSIDDALGIKHFDVVQCPSDHHFLEGYGKSGGGKKWVRKVQQEWNILEKNLPDDIYVRVFEDRMDLIRAVIIGASGTPYQDGLFFFDFLLPTDYPQVPPTAYYHSGGLRVNPNLYTDGKVCLSLLNTWTGKGNEVWDPSSSTILQVLVSIQGLVLNERPYFNEAGYEKQVGTIEGEKNVMPYNENTYLLNLKSMLYLLRRPPMHFEDFVREHFRTRGYYILKACGAYLEGSAIGSLASDASTTEKSRESSCSVGFKLTLTKLLPRLISALREVGANCDAFEHLSKPESSHEGQSC